MDLEVLGGVRVDDVLALVEVVDHDDGRLSAGQGRRDPLGVLGLSHLALELDHAPPRRGRRAVTRTLAAIGSCSAWLIRSAATYAGSAVSSARIAISVGPASESMPTTPRSSRLAATP